MSAVSRVWQKMEHIGKVLKTSFMKNQINSHKSFLTPERQFSLDKGLERTM